MIVLLQGGMGNQMFQVAFGRSQLAECFFDKSGIVPPRTYALDPFRLPIRFAPPTPGALSGYWQSEKYFNHAQARAIFSNPKTEKEFTEMCAIHVRLTDNLSERALAFHGNLLDTNYYQKAMKLVTERTGCKVFVVFSDDSEWCVKNLKWKNVAISATARQPHLDLWEMARFPYIIIANSSFSWWAAWLSPQKLVVAPKRWFVVDVPGAADIVPERWTQI